MIRYALYDVNIFTSFLEIPYFNSYLTFNFTCSFFHRLCIHLIKKQQQYIHLLFSIKQYKKYNHHVSKKKQNFEFSKATLHYHPSSLMKREDTSLI